MNDFDYLLTMVRLRRAMSKDWKVSVPLSWYGDCRACGEATILNHDRICVACVADLDKHYASQEGK